MLIDGVILEQGPMNPPHAVGLSLVVEVLRGVFHPGWLVRGQMPLNVGQKTDPLPDVAVVRGDTRTFLKAHPTSASLVVEISDTTLRFDLTEKAALYANGGITDYWVLDVDNRRLIVHRDPVVASDGVRYATVTTLSPTDSVSPLAAPGTSIPVANLLP
jgi:Uma2 family endonuclease